MSGILGIGGGSSGILSIAMQGALAVATGGSSLALTTALRGVMLSVGDQVLQQLGKEMGLPPAVTDMASAVMHAEAGDVGGAMQSVNSAYSDLQQAGGLSDSQTGQLQQQGFDGAKWLLDQLMQKMQSGDLTNDGASKKKQAAAAGGGAAGAAGGAAAGSTTGADGAGATTTADTGGADSFLVKLAMALGKVIDNKMDKMVDVANQIDKAQGSGNSQTASLSAQETALGQEVSLISNALNTAIKSLGDAASTLARKS